MGYTGRHTGTKSLKNTTYRVTELRELAVFIINNEINVFCVRNTVCSLHSKVPLYHSRPHFLVFKVDWFQLKTVKPGQNSLRPADQSQGRRRRPWDDWEPSTFFSQRPHGRREEKLCSHPPSAPWRTRTPAPTWLWPSLIPPAD